MKPSLRKILVVALTLALPMSAWAAYKYGQCTAITKDGTRCTRGVSNAGDTYCYQHKK